MSADIIISEEKFPSRENVNVEGGNFTMEEISQFHNIIFSSPIMDGMEVQPFGV